MSDFLQGKLDNQEIKEKMINYSYKPDHKPSEKLINNIIEQFWFHDPYNSFVSDKVFLQHLLNYLDLINSKNFNRYDFYKYLFDQIGKESSIRKKLHQIALDFEKNQTDALSPEDYQLLLQQLHIPASEFDCAWMQSHHLGSVKERDKQKLFIWEHHTLTEFLVAEYLLSEKKTIEAFDKLAILNQEGITAFKSSWSGVLRFLIETPKQQEVISWLLTFLQKYPDNLDDNIAELLVFDAPNSSSEVNRKIFDLIYNSYFDRVVWLPAWARNRIAHFVGEEEYSRIKEDIKEWSNTTETFVRRGNAVSVVEGLLHYESKLLTQDEKEFWKNTLIGFANDPQDNGNGVLQRHSLGALAEFKNDEIIPLVAQKCFEETTDSLVRDEFIQFCIVSAANSSIAIDYFIKGIKSGSNIYARHGLYEIDEQEAIEYFVAKISNDEAFISSFLEHESVFDKDGADKRLVKHIAEKANAKIINDLKKIIFVVIRMRHLYKKERSSFLREVVKIIAHHDSQYLFEILKDIKDEKYEDKIDWLVYDSKELIAPLLTPSNLKEYFKAFDSFPERSKRDASYPIYIAKRLNGEIGNQVYREAVKLGYIQEIDQDQAQQSFDEQQKKRKQDVYNGFLQMLEPSPDKYNPEVFQYFTHNEKDIKEQWKEKDIERLKKLAIEWGIAKIDPRQFQLTIQNSHGGNNQFTWSSQAAFFGDMLDVIKIIAPEEITKYRQKIIDFIPFNFDTGSPLDFIPKIKDTELEWVNSVMSDTKNDRRYLIPQTYIYTVGEYAKRGCKLPSIKPILISFIDDPQIQGHNQSFALEILPFFTDKSDSDTKMFLQHIFETSKNIQVIRNANSALISIFQDENAINWRFAKLKEPIKFNQREYEGEVHEVGPAEEELDTLALAKPLIDLKDEKYLPNFFDLLKYSFDIVKENRDKKYWDYINYLWRIVCSFIENLKENNSFIPLLEFEHWIEKSERYENLNWLKLRVREVERNYINFIHPYDKLIDGVEALSKLNLPAAHIAYFLFKSQIVETELRKLIDGINYSLEKINSDLSIYRKEKQNVKDSRKNSTLGQLKTELDNYQGKSIDKLKTRLSLFHQKRNDFTHQLFLQEKSMYQLGEDSKKYTKHAEESLILIQEVWKEILKIN